MLKIALSRMECEHLDEYLCKFYLAHMYKKIYIFFCLRAEKKDGLLLILKQTQITRVIVT